MDQQVGQLKPAFYVAVVTVIVALLGYAYAEEAVEKPDPNPASFAIFCDERTEVCAAELMKIFQKAERTPPPAIFKTPGDLLASKSQVFVLLTSRNFTGEQIEHLKMHRVITMGYDPGMLFKSMGLQIHSRACAHFGDANSDIVMRASILLGEGAAERKAFKATRPMIEPIGEWRTDYYGMHIPKKSPDCAFVDVIARVPYNPSYAPIVREGNCVMICLDAHPTLWTDEFKAVVQEVGTTLLDRKLEPFTRAQRPVSAAGVHAFKLAKSGDTDELSGHHLYFKFDKPVTFRAKVEHTGSKSLMFLFMGENSECWHREDASNGESLELKVSITQKQLDSIKDGYWELKVSNFDANNTAEGKIEVKIDNP